MRLEAGQKEEEPSDKGYSKISRKRMGRCVYLMLTVHCRFPQCGVFGRRTPSVGVLASLSFGVPLHLAQPPTKGGVCFHASDFVLED